MRRLQNSQQRKTCLDSVNESGRRKSYISMAELGLSVSRGMWSEYK